MYLVSDLCLDRSHGFMAPQFLVPALRCVAHKKAERLQCVAHKKAEGL